MKLKKKYLWAITAHAITVAFMGFPMLVSGETARPNSMTVDDCISRTGMTKDRCQEMIDNFKNMAPPKDGAKMMPPQNKKGQLPASEVTGERPTPSASVNTNKAAENDANDFKNLIIEKISKLQTEKEQQLNQAESRIAKIIEFLKSKDANIAEAENVFGTFKTKITAVSSAFDAYVQVLNNAKTDTSEAAATAVQNAKEQIKATINDLMDSYHTLRVALNDAISKTNQ